MNSEFDGRDRGQTRIAKNGGNAKIRIVHNTGYHLMKFLLKYVHGHITFFYHRGLLLRLRQGTLVHLLVLVQGDGLNLHRHGRHHIGRLLVEDEVIQRLNVYLLVADDIGCNKLTSTSSFLIKSLYGSVLDTRELADNGFHLFQLNAETADLHLSVATAHELNVA